MSATNLQMLVAALRSIPTATLSDSMERLVGTCRLRRFHAGGPVAGIAFTVRTANGDNSAVNAALEQLKAGDVLVVDGGGDETRALVGEIICARAEQRGAAGLVIDGAVRDTAILAQSTFPCFARAACMRGPYKNGPGHLQVAVSIDGMIVQPGDIVVGDDDGVVAIPPGAAEDLLRSATERMQREQAFLASITGGA
jgi:RraA family protein